MKNQYIIVFAALLAFTACGEKKGSVQEKRAALEKIKKEIAALQSKAKQLETEIAKLEPTKENNKLVETEVIAAAAFESYLDIEGKADAEQSTIATAQVPGTVTQVIAKAGDAVSAGQALAYLDNSTLRQSRLQLEQQLSFANTLFEKQKRLWQQGVGTEVQYLTAKNQKEALEKNLSTLDAQLAMYTIKSPINGTVESVDLKIGQVAAPDINKTIDSKVTFASKVIDPLNRTFRIEIRLNNVADVKPNMLAKLKIADYQNKSALTVPTNAITSGVEETYVMVRETSNGKEIARKRLVKTGHTGETRTEILEGLKAGDAVIVTGYQELNDGQTIESSK